MDSLTHVFDGVVALVRTWAEQYGAGGLAVVAFLDSSFLALPQAPDALVIGLTIAHPAQAFLYAVAASLGSAAGCYALFAVGRGGGEAFLRRRLKERHVDRGLKVIARHGWMAVTVPSLLPPPAPFKPFVLLAGVSGLRPATFLAAVFVGRMLRYGAEAILAYAYGDRALVFISGQGSTILALSTAVMVMGTGALLLWRRHRTSVGDSSAPS